MSRLLARIVGLEEEMPLSLTDAHRPLSRPTLVVIDLTEATVIDSSMISAIAWAHDAAQHDPDAQVTIVVESPECFVARVLRLVGMTRKVPTYTSRAAALAALNRLTSLRHSSHS